MLENFENGWIVFKQSLMVLGRYPKFLLPLVAWWALYALLVLYAQFFFPWSQYQLWACVAFVLVVVILWSAALGIACLVMLEMIRQIQADEPVNTTKAVVKVLEDDFARALPITLVWSLLHVILGMIQGLGQKGEGEGSGGRLSPQSAAETLANYDPHFGLWDLLFQSSKAALMMVVFLILPAIAWEGLWPVEATKKGLHILKAHLSVFASGFVLTQMAGIAVFIPISILITLAQVHIPVSDSIWYAAILYSGLAVTLVLFLEQMFAAQLYLWHLRWVKVAESAKASGQPLPKFRDVAEPVIFPGTPNFLALREFFDL